MIFMDIEKQPSKESDSSFTEGASKSHGLRSSPAPRRRYFLRKTLGSCAGLLILLLFLRTFPTHTVDHYLSKSASNSSSSDSNRTFSSVPNTESALEASRAYATHPHLAGSSEDFLDAKVLLHLFQDEFNIRKPLHLPIFPAGTPESRNATLLLTGPDAPNRPTAWIDTYYPVMNTGVEQGLQILDTNGPAYAHKYKDTIPTWHGLSSDGDVTGQLIYANYGRKEDYDELVAQGTNFTGKIVLTRYGANFRGLKIKGAQELGALGVLIYSDPRDDGYVTVKNDYSPYPAGLPGTLLLPTTPGYPAYEDAERTEGSNIPKIPSLPISWHNAERLLEEIGDVYVQTEEGKKRLSGKASQRNIRLVNHVDTKVTPIWNTMASIPGHIKNEVVVIGCHRDAWVLGAADPTSGTVSLHEIIRGYGALLRKGWKPLRTIVIASWDAEEYGLIGSTEWGEDFGPWISEHVVAYLNVDVSVAGSRLSISGSPSLAHIIKQTALDNGTADADFLELYFEQERKLKASKTRVHPLGSGTPRSRQLRSGFGGTLSDAPYHYHSIYDSQSWQERYADPGFHRHVSTTSSWRLHNISVFGLRITDSIVLPLNTTQYSLELDDYLDERRIGSLRRAADWVKSIFGVSPPTEEELQRLSLRKCMAWLALPYPKVYKAAKRVAKANKKLIAFERGFISEGGYGATTFPGLTEAITYEKNITLIHHEANRLEILLKALAATIEP
ncbi:Zn-dependent exopeptidase [Pholiota molesta]|nr:Zn-dependent exopeptidase [Pholiota molesta]